MDLGYNIIISANNPCAFSCSGSVCLLINWVFLWFLERDYELETSFCLTWLQMQLMCHVLWICFFLLHHPVIFQGCSLLPGFYFLSSKYICLDWSNLLLMYLTYYFNTTKCPHFLEISIFKCSCKIPYSSFVSFCTILFPYEAIIYLIFALFWLCSLLYTCIS